MKFLAPTLLIAVAAVLLTPMAAPLAAPITTLFNTGVDASGTPQANLAAETHYSLVSAQPGSATGVRVATAANGFPIPPWVGDNAVSAWIGPNSDSALNGPTGNYDYRTTFSLTGLTASTAFISGRWSTDDSGVDILLNGVSPSSFALGYSFFYNFSLTSGFQSGINTLDFIVNNGGGPTGLRVEMTGTADPISVPEPASLALLGAGLLSLGVIRRKRA